MSKTLLILPESNNAATLLLDKVGFKVIRDDNKLLISVPDDYIAEQSGEGGLVTLQPQANVMPLPTQNIAPQFSVVDTGRAAKVRLYNVPQTTDANHRVTADLDFSSYNEGPKFERVHLIRFGNRHWFGEADNLPIMVDAEDQSIMFGNLLFTADLEPLARLVD